MGVGRPSRAAGSLARLVGAVCAGLGVAMVAWLAVIVYRGSPADERLTVAIGIPVLLLIVWAGLFLFFGGLARLVARRRSGG